jgi:hypothetical protein
VSAPPESGTKSHDLEGLQRFMVSAIQRPTPLVEDAGQLASRTSSAIAGNARLTPIEQLDIYREQFWLRHVGSLREDFPSLVHVLGDESFDELAREYLAAHPPESFTLRDLGDKLPSFVETRAPWAGDPLLADIARLEWAFVEAFDAPDAPPFDVRTLAGGTEDAWAGARIVFQPSMRRLVLAYPAHELRGKVRAGEAAERPDPRDSWVVIYRAGLGHQGSTADAGTLQYIDVERLAYHLLGALAEGTPLAAACERVVAANAEVDMARIEAHIGGWFQQWGAFGWISRVDYGADR